MLDYKSIIVPYNVLSSSVHKRYEAMWSRSLSVSMIKTLTGTLPLTFRTSETALRSWTIYGNDFQHEESRGTRLPLSFYTDENKVRDWTIYGNNTQHNYSAEGTLPLTFTTHTAGVASDWSISGNDKVGKNLLDVDSYELLQTDTNTYRCAVSLGDLPAGTYTLSYNSEYGQFLYIVQRTGNAYNNVTASSPYTFSVSASVDEVMVRTTQQTASPWTNVGITYVMLRPADTSPDFEPYTVGVGERTTNLFDKSATDTNNGYVDRSYITSTGTTLSSENWNISEYIDVTPSTTYIFCRGTESGTSVSYAEYDSDLTFIRAVPYGGERNVVITTSSNTAKIRLSIYRQAIDSTMLIKGSTAPTTYIPYGYEIPLTISQQGQTDKTYDIYIGTDPLTAGQSISKTSTGVDIAAMAGSNIITTELYNKPSMSIEGVDYVGVGEPTNDGWQIPLTVTHYTDNIFDKDAKNTNKGYEDSTCLMWAGSIPNPYLTGNEDNNYFVSEKIPCSPNTTYYLTDGIFKNTDNGIYSVFLWNRYRMSDYQAFPTEKTFITGDDTKFIQLCVLKAYADTVMITTQPTETYIPHVEVNNVNIPIDAPLSASDTATKTSTGVDIPTYVGTNTISTTLENKPEMRVDYGYKGVGEHSGDTWELYFITSANGNQQLTKITMDKPLRAGETLTSEQAGVTIPTYANAENTLSLYPNAAGYGNPEMTITYKGG